MEELNNWNRRKFIRTSALGAGFMFLQNSPLSLFASQSEHIKLTILHTNDTHSHLEPFPIDGSKNQGLGGVARRMSLIKKIRSEEKNVLLLDAGDIWQGTPYFNMFGGEVEYKVMNEMGYDAATLGNHDFDAGLEGLAKQLPKANFTFLCANYDFSNTILKDKFIPYKVFEKGGLRIGVYAVCIELAGLVPDKCFGDTIYNSPLEAALKQEELLKNKEKCDLIICLSHLGYKYDSSKISDQKLAASLNKTDLIIGGHTHTFMDAPEEIKNNSGGKTLIFQVGWAGINLGRLDFYVDKKTSKKLAFGSSVKISEK